MFSGIVEAVSIIQSILPGEGVVRIKVDRPVIFDDIKIGDSIALNGICLTVESFDDHLIQFALGSETLRILQLNLTNPERTLGKVVNLERSLRFGDRIHGHLVTGHVDSLCEVVQCEKQGESLFLGLKVADSILPYVWKKGSITLNGASLTVNSVAENIISVCLIPETQKRTNLGRCHLGDLLTAEPDYMAKAVVRGEEIRKKIGGVHETTVSI